MDPCHAASPVTHTQDCDIWATKDPSWGKENKEAGHTPVSAGKVPAKGSALALLQAVHPVVKSPGSDGGLRGCSRRTRREPLSFS